MDAQQLTLHLGQFLRQALAVGGLARDSSGLGLDRIVIPAFPSKDWLKENTDLKRMLKEAEANAPLIADGTDEDEDHEELDARSKKRLGGQEKTTLMNAGKVVWLLTFSAGISGLLFGYDTGVISSTLVSIGSDLSGRELTTTDKSLITAVTSLFALFSAPTVAGISGTLVLSLTARHAATLKKYARRGRCWPATCGSNSITARPRQRNGPSWKASARFP